MKRLTILLLISLVLVGLTLCTKYLFDVNRLSAQASSTKPEPDTAFKQSAFKEVVMPVYEKPSRIKIVSVAIETDLFELGLESDGSLSVPSDYLKAGWFYDSARVGEPGNIIIDAHYDTNTGAPAAFWNLKNVKTGDIVSVIDNVGRSFDYEVREIFYLDINDPNRLQIFDEDKETSHVTLITCGGIWLPGHFTYSKRLVVKAELVS